MGDKILETNTNDSQSAPVQAMPLVQGGVNLTSGVLSNVALIECVADGSIDITWEDDATDTITCEAGAHYQFGVNAKTVEIVSGTFHVVLLGRM